MDFFEILWLLLLLGWAYSTIISINLFWEMRKRKRAVVIDNYSQECDHLINEILERFLKIGVIQIRKNPNILDLESRDSEIITFSRKMEDGNIRESSEYGELLFILERNLPRVIYVKIKLIDELIKKALEYKDSYNEKLSKEFTPEINQMLKELRNKIIELDRIIAKL